MAAVVVLGCKPDTDRLVERSCAAAEVWRAQGSRDCLFMCSGWASQEGPSEACLIATYAQQLGIPESCMVLEEKARNTIENALNLLPILLELKVLHVILVTSEYHMPRARLVFELVLQDTSMVMSWAAVRLHRHCPVQMFEQARSRLTSAARDALARQEARGMQHLLQLAARSDFMPSMLRDPALTHPDLLRPCASLLQKTPLRMPDASAEDQAAVQAVIVKSGSSGLSKAGGAELPMAGVLSRALSRVQSLGQCSVREELQQQLQNKGALQQPVVLDQLIAAAYPDSHQPMR